MIVHLAEFGIRIQCNIRPIENSRVPFDRSQGENTASQAQTRRAKDWNYRKGAAPRHQSRLRDRRVAWRSRHIARSCQGSMASSAWLETRDPARVARGRLGHKRGERITPRNPKVQLPRISPLLLEASP